MGGLVMIVVVVFLCYWCYQSGKSCWRPKVAAASDGPGDVAGSPNPVVQVSRHVVRSVEGQFKPHVRSPPPRPWPSALPALSASAGGAGRGRGLGLGVGTPGNSVLG